MRAPRARITRALRYNSLKTTFEGRLASLADTVRRAVESVQQDQVLQQLNANVNTTEFAPAHAHVLIKRHLASERDAFFHDLALRLADAEAEVSQCNRRNEELGSSLSVLQSDASREEQSRVQATVNADIQELRREYQVCCPKLEAHLILYCCTRLQIGLTPQHLFYVSDVHSSTAVAVHRRSMHQPAPAAPACRYALGKQGVSKILQELVCMPSLIARTSFSLCHLSPACV